MMIWRFGDHTFDLSERSLIVGIVNVTPDSFSDGGTFLDPEAACNHGLKLLAEGADLLDIGAESTRPGATPVSELEELGRLLPVIRALRKKTDAPLSIDTFKSGVAAAALDAGADIINDITALSDPHMGPLVASHRAGLILMHMQGTPETMQMNPAYPEEGVVETVVKFLSDRQERAIGLGVDAASLILDPGLGFGKTVEHNLALLQSLPTLTKLGAPVMIGHSRKSFLGAVTGSRAPVDRLAAGLAVTALARAVGVRLFRVHEARFHREALTMTETLS
jgi:dihydropteroate synthase